MVIQKEKNLQKRISNQQFTVQDFIALLFPLLYKNGVYKINENELEEKLYCYYEKNDFQELFQDIVPYHESPFKRLNLSAGLYSEKYLGRSIRFDPMCSNILHLAYGLDINLPKNALASLSEDGQKKMKQLALELAKDYKAERTSKSKLKILRYNPNSYYSLVCGNCFSKLLSSDLITDGNISSITYFDTTSQDQLYCENPSNPNETIHLKNATVASVAIQNASYVIKRGLHDEAICQCTIHTQLLDDKQLQQMVVLANQLYKEKQDVVVDSKPYIRRISLK